MRCDRRSGNGDDSNDDDGDDDDDGRGRDVAQVCGHRLPKTDGNDDNGDDDAGDDDGGGDGDACENESERNQQMLVFNSNDRSHSTVCQLQKPLLVNSFQKILAHFHSSVEIGLRDAFLRTYENMKAFWMRVRTRAWDYRVRRWLGRAGARF